MPTRSDDAASPARLVRITGRVQGVGFRVWTRDEALRRGLDGWVRNEPDGAVRALISGPDTALGDMLAALHRGPAFARVNTVEATPADPPERPGFHILR